MKKQLYFILISAIGINLSLFINNAYSLSNESWWDVLISNARVGDIVLFSACDGSEDFPPSECSAAIIENSTSGLISGLGYGYFQHAALIANIGDGYLDVFQARAPGYGVGIDRYYIENIEFARYKRIGLYTVPQLSDNEAADMMTYAIANWNNTVYDQFIDSTNSIYYCSELVWATYDARNIDLAEDASNYGNLLGLGTYWITPDEISLSKHVEPKAAIIIDYVPNVSHIIPILSLLLLDNEQDYPIGGLNDTGVTWGRTHPSGNNSQCIGTEIGSQDCYVGRDSKYNDGLDGHAGFSFEKLDSNGKVLPSDAASWSCVKDNVTGLIWEVKTNDGGLHDRDDTYVWYNTDTNTNGGYPGYYDDKGANCFGYESGVSTTFCNTEAYVNRVNSVGLCGASDWRLPTKSELVSIISYGNYSPAIDTGYFPNVSDNAFNYYWTSTALSYMTQRAWAIRFLNGYVNYNYDTGNLSYIRLVRGK